MNGARNAMGNTDFKNFDEREQKILSSAGMDFSEKQRVGSFFQTDDEVLLMKSLLPGVEIMAMEEALGKYPGIKEYYGRAFAETGQEFPADTRGGYFIRVRENVETDLPIQACLFLKQQKFVQKVHNLIIAEPGAKVHIITGCASSHSAGENIHLGVSEFFVQKGAYVNFSMIHSWKKDTDVQPKSVALVDEQGTFLSNYVCLNPVRKVVMYPAAVLRGRGAKARFNSLLLAHPGSLQDIGSRVLFKNEETSAEIVSRAVSSGGKVIARGHLKAESPRVKAHLECRGLMLSQQGLIHAVPELETIYQDVDMSHEAAIGKVSKEEIEYLRARGMDEDEAQAVIIRGFMDTGILALPEVLKAEIDRLTEETVKSGL